MLADPNVHPGATETVNGIDDDCAGGIPANEADDDLDGFRGCAGDCDDNDEGVNPGELELCGDGIDQDCSGQDLACAGNLALAGTASQKL